MTDTESRPDRGPSPLLALFFCAPLPLALGALLSDWAYSGTYQIQWINFADWLVAGSLVFGGLALIASVSSITMRRRWRDRADVLAVAVLLLFLVMQFYNALTHSKDAYATMPAGLIQSVVATVLAFAAAWLGLANVYKRSAR